MSTAAGAAQDLKVIEFNRKNFCEQSQSPLFSVLPGEIRDRIFAFTLAEFEDTSIAFDKNTCYLRPDYAAPRRSDTALLRTCQRVYEEAFFYPFSLAEQTMFFAWHGRRPDNVTTVQSLRPSLALVNKLHGDTELASVRVFAQLCSLESGGQLNEILEMPHFLPRSMTVTIRHTDIWSWESDAPIRIGGEWTSVCRFPNSLRYLNVQVESLERKKDQVDYVVNQMIRKWHFTRKDNTILSATADSISIMRWSGSSTWEGQRWIRDETRPETIDYYVATVSFRPLPPDQTKPINANTYTNHESLQLDPMPNVVTLHTTRAYVDEGELAERSIPPGWSADQVITRFDQHLRDQAALVAQRRADREANRVQERALVAARREVRARFVREAREQRLRLKAQRELQRAGASVIVDGEAEVKPEELKAARAQKRAAIRARAAVEEIIEGDMDVLFPKSTDVQRHSQ